MPQCMYWLSLLQKHYCNNNQQYSIAGTPTQAAENGEIVMRECISVAAYIQVGSRVSKYLSDCGFKVCKQMA